MDQSGTTRYILYKDGQEIFHTDTFPENELQSLNGASASFPALTVSFIWTMPLTFTLRTLCPHSAGSF